MRCQRGNASPQEICRISNAHVKNSTTICGFDLGLPSPCAIVMYGASVKFAGLEGPVQCSAYFRSLSKSRISVRSTSSFEIFGSSAGFSSSCLFNEFIPFIAINIAKAIIAKSIIVWMNFP